MLTFDDLLHQGVREETHRVWMLTSPNPWKFTVCLSSVWRVEGQKCFWSVQVGQPKLLPHRGGKHHQAPSTNREDVWCYSKKSLISPCNFEPGLVFMASKGGNLPGIPGQISPQGCSLNPPTLSWHMVVRLYRISVETLKTFQHIFAICFFWYFKSETLSLSC